MDSTQIRRKNINVLADKYGRDILASKIGYKDTIYLNQLCGGHGSFGSRTARKIEVSLGLEHGWMDQDHSSLSGNAVEESRETYGGIPVITLEQAKAWAPTGEPYPDSYTDRVQTAHKLGPQSYLIVVQDDSLGVIAPPETRLYIDPAVGPEQSKLVAYYLVEQDSFVIGTYIEMPGRKFIVLPGYNEKYAIGENDIPCGRVMIREHLE